VALGRSGDLTGALAFSDASIEERGDTPYIWLARGDVLLARAETRADYCLEKALLLAPRDWFTVWLAARVRHYYKQFALALKLLQHAVELNTAHFVLWLDLGRCQEALGLVSLAPKFFRPSTTTPAGVQPGRAGAGSTSPWQLRRALARLVAEAGISMSTNNLDRLLAAASDFDASDLHLVAGVPPAFRVNGEIIIADEDSLSEAEVERIAYSLLNEQQRKKFDQEWELCISLVHPAIGRVRATFYRRNGHPEMSCRFCGDRVSTREELGLPEKLDELARRPNGLVLVTGPTGAGKTTTLNYLVDLINSERRCKIVTIEDPIEFVHANKRAIVVQQEVLTDVRSFNRALIHVLRQDPDVIVVGEMRDFEAISTALTAAETGHLVLATMHSPSVSHALERIVGVFEGSAQRQIILQLSNCASGNHRSGIVAGGGPHAPGAGL